ncbi:hypothetical protein B0J13DRAFT_655671 [Dactylonectria estremocensis]|uniref:Uncharacterized protein n=1 Tax=Dactylonectria estremocensis TaxID=1079267 RepID=A0A9P9D8X0_9HYPO|nr:hypothetical protein B0J13DRAFT_655671 [Dactylonectria estremocensis]
MAPSYLVLAALVRAAVASITIEDPSDVILPSDWAADDALWADYDISPLNGQPRDLATAYTFDKGRNTVKHRKLSTDQNDTCVVVVSDGAHLTATQVDILKTGYSSNLNEASFYGFNAAVNVANASTAYLHHVNITVHNGAANVYGYGSETEVHVNDAWLYSSGPVAHGLYASGNATIIGRNIKHYSGGTRSSAFSGDGPAGYIWVYDSTSHCAGRGSATYYALGTIYAENVISHSENGPVLFSDGAQSAELVNCDATAGLLGGVAMFSSSTRISGAKLKLKDSKITTLGETIPGLWFGNLIASVEINNSQINHSSGVLVAANYSQITQEFDHYAGYEENSNLSPAKVTVKVVDSALDGDLVAYNGSSISFALTSYSSWVGAAYSGYGKGIFNVALDKSSNWTLTKTTTVQNLTDSDTTFSNIHSNGFNLYYNSSAIKSRWLKGRTVKLNGGGSAKPISRRST